MVMKPAFDTDTLSTMFESSYSSQSIDEEVRKYYSLMRRSVKRKASQSTQYHQPEKKNPSEKKK